MDCIRILLRNNCRLAALVVALALCVKALVPPGYMIGELAKGLAIEVCDGRGDQLVAPAALAGHGKSDSDGAHRKDHGICPYSSLTMASHAGSADVPLLALALLFILTLGFAPRRAVRIERRRHLRPPLRGPPLPA